MWKICWCALESLSSHGFTGFEISQYQLYCVLEASLYSLRLEETMQTRWSEVSDWPAVDLYVHLIFSLGLPDMQSSTFRHMKWFKMRTQQEKNRNARLYHCLFFYRNVWWSTTNVILHLRLSATRHAGRDGWRVWDYLLANSKNGCGNAEVHRLVNAVNNQGIKGAFPDNWCQPRGNSCHIGAPEKTKDMLKACERPEIFNAS